MTGPLIAERERGGGKGVKSGGAQFGTGCELEASNMHPKDMYPRLSNNPGSLLPLNKGHLRLVPSLFESPLHIYCHDKILSDAASQRGSFTRASPNADKKYQQQQQTIAFASYGKPSWLPRHFPAPAAALAFPAKPEGASEDGYSSLQKYSNWT